MSTTHYIPSTSGWASQRVNWAESSDDNGRLRVKCVREYNAATNKSTLTISLQVQSTSTSGYFQVRQGGTITVNGTTLYTFPSNILYTATVNQDSNWRSVHVHNDDTPMTWTTELSHDASGDLTITVAANLAMTYQPGSVVYAMYWNNSGSITVQEPRASTISSVTNPVTTGGTLTVSMDRKSTAFYHKATVKKGSDTLYTSAAFGASLSLTVPASWFLNYASSTSLSCTVSVQTYTDSSCTTTVGSAVTASFTVKAGASTIASIPASVTTQNTLTITMSRVSSAYYHKATVKKGSTTLYTSAAFGASLSLTVPASWFANYASSTSLSCTVSVQTYTDSSCTTTVGSPATASLTVKAGASTIYSIPASVTTQNTLTINMSRVSSAYYHKATVKKGSTTLYTSSAFGASMSMAAPRSWFTNFGSVTSLSCTVSVQTYTNSSCTTAVGDPVTASLTVKADSGMKPALQSGYAAAAPYNTGTAAANITGYVSGISKAQVTLDSAKLDMSAAVGAGVSSIKVKCGSVEAASAPYRTGVLTGTATITVTVTDTRGRSATQTLTVQTMPYAPPTISQAKAYRCDVDGNEDEDGTYSRHFAVAGCSSLNGQNSVKLYVRNTHGSGSPGSWWEIASGQWERLGSGSQNPDLITRVEYKAVDSLGTYTIVSVLIPGRVWAMKFRASGLGVGFGMKPDEENVLQLPPGWKIKIGTTVVAHD